MRRVANWHRRRYVRGAPDAASSRGEPPRSPAPRHPTTGCGPPARCRLSQHPSLMCGNSTVGLRATLAIPQLGDAGHAPPQDGPMWRDGAERQSAGCDRAAHTGRAARKTPQGPRRRSEAGHRDADGNPTFRRVHARRSRSPVGAAQRLPSTGCGKPTVGNRTESAIPQSRDGGRNSSWRHTCCAIARAGTRTGRPDPCRTVSGPGCVSAIGWGVLPQLGDSQ